MNLRFKDAEGKNRSATLEWLRLGAAEASWPPDGAKDSDPTDRSGFPKYCSPILAAREIR